jgi:hypothetical protein
LDKEESVKREREEAERQTKAVAEWVSIWTMGNEWCLMYIDFVFSLPPVILA